MNNKTESKEVQIEEILKTVDRLTVGHRWLVFCPALDVWEVFERLSPRHHSRIIVQTKDLVRALNVLREIRE